MSHVVKSWVYVTHLLNFTSLFTTTFNIMTPFNWATFLENGGSTSFHIAGDTHLAHYTVSQLTNTHTTPQHPEPPHTKIYIYIYHYGNLRCQEWLHLYVFTVHTPILTETSNTRSDMYTNRHDM